MARLGTPWSTLPAVLLVFLAAGCGDAPEPEGVGSEQPAVQVSQAPLQYEPALLDLGPIVPGGFVERSVTVRNGSRRTVEVIDYSAPCECTSLAPELPRSLGPGESFELPVRMDLSSLLRGGLPGQPEAQARVLERSLRLWTKDGQSAELQLRATVSEDLALDPAVVDFGEVLRGEPAEARVLVSPGRGRSDQPVSVLEVRPVGDGPHPEVEDKRQAGDVELLLRLPPLPESGPWESRMEVLTDAQEAAAPLMLRARVVEPIQVTPERIDVRAAPPDEPFLVRLHLRRRDGAALEIESVRSTSGRILTEAQGLSRSGAQVVRVVAAVRPWPAVTEGEIHVVTDLEGEAGRLKVPVRVQARQPR